MKQISLDQINAILQTVYETNIPAKSFNALKELFVSLKEATVVNVEADKPAEITN